MKWRQTVVYLIILVLVAGYYYYFEVVKKREREEAQRAAKKVFQIQKDTLDAVTVIQKDKVPVELEKEDGRWKIKKPVVTEAEDTVVDSLVTALADLERERKLDESPSDLKPFGLDDPALVLRFREKGAWRELRLGSKNPSGDAYYADTGKGTPLFLVASGNYGVLNKGLGELRRRQLFAFENDEVTRLQVSWSDGKEVILERSKDRQWTAPEDAKRRIKASKVENVLDQIRWLRAKNFLEDEGKDLQESGLGAVRVTVTIRRGDKKESVLKISEPKEGEDTVRAFSSELPFVVSVDKDILEDLPRSLWDVEDRSVLHADTDQITEVSWLLNGKEGRVVRIDEGKWGAPQPQGKPRELKESWRVRSLFWEWEDLEYQQKSSEKFSVPEDESAVKVVFRADGDEVASFLWAHVPEKLKDDEVVPLQIKGGEVVLVKSKHLKTIQKKLRDLEKELEGKTEGKE